MGQMPDTVPTLSLSASVPLTSERKRLISSPVFSLALCPVHTSTRVLPSYTRGGSPHAWPSFLLPAERSGGLNASRCGPGVTRSPLGGEDGAFRPPGQGFGRCRGPAGTTWFTRASCSVTGAPWLDIVRPREVRGACAQGERCPAPGGCAVDPGRGTVGSPPCPSLPGHRNPAPLFLRGPRSPGSAPRGPSSWPRVLLVAPREPASHQLPGTADTLCSAWPLPKNPGSLPGAVPRN